MQHSRCGLTNAEQRSSITSLVWLPAHLLTQPRTPCAFFAAGAHFCLMVDVMFISVLSLSCQAAFQPCSPQCAQVPAVLPPQGQDLVLPFFELHEVPVSLSRSLQMAAQLLRPISCSSQFGVICTSAEGVQSTPSFRCNCRFAQEENSNNIFEIMM